MARPRAWIREPGGTTRRGGGREQAARWAPAGKPLPALRGAYYGAEVGLGRGRRNRAAGVEDKAAGVGEEVDEFTRLGLHRFRRAQRHDSAWIQVPNENHRVLHQFVRQADVGLI